MSHNIYSDQEKNILYIQLGVVEKNNYELFQANLIKHSKNLEPGFTCITDLRSFHINPGQDSNFHKMIKFVQDTLTKKGAKKFIRIVQPQALVISQILLSDMKKERDSSFVSSMDEAEKLLPCPLDDI